MAAEPGQFRFPSAVRTALTAAAFALSPAVTLGIPPPSAPAAAQSSPDRAADKAAFLLELARFVDWPESLFDTTDSPFVVGVLGDEAIRDVFSRELSGRRVDRHPVRVVGFTNLDEVEPCPILYVGHAKARLMPVIVEFLDGATVLTVSDREEFLERGGILRLIETPDRIAFEIDVGAGARLGLGFSSRLLRIADRVVPGPIEPGAP